jgi:hypothetical protein
VIMKPMTIDFDNFFNFPEDVFQEWFEKLSPEEQRKVEQWILENNNETNR